MSTIELRGRIEDDLVALLSEQLAAMELDEGPVEIDLSSARIDELAVATALAEVVKDAVRRLGSIKVVSGMPILNQHLAGVAGVELSTG